MEFEQLSYLRVAYGVLQVRPHALLTLSLASQRAEDGQLRLQASLATFLVAWVGYAAAGTRILGPDTSLVSLLSPVLARVAQGGLTAASRRPRLSAGSRRRCFFQRWPS